LLLILSKADAGLNANTGIIEGDWLRKVEPFAYALKIEQKKCFSANQCPYNVVEQTGFYDNYNIVAQSCGSHLKNDATSGLKNCELFQINLLEEKTTKEQLVVNVMSYSGGVEGYDAVECPSEPTFDYDTLQTDINMDGILLFVKQCSGENCTKTDDWECLL